jgi:NAD(P)-dependent dehydrogenase (short-subunit alcohol dehydrogenase family)
MPTNDLVGRTVFITGATGGIGRTTAQALAARDATVIIGARSEEKARPLVEELRQLHPRAVLSFVLIDLASLASVRRAADTMLASGRPLDVLINNAGRAGRGGMTVDGFEITIGTNHIGPFLLTELLLPMLGAATQGRIVNVASRAHMGVKRLDWGALARPPGIKGGIGAYGVSKLMNVLHAKELARRLSDTRITTYALHPGVVASDIWRELPRPVQWVMKRFMISNEEGARTSLYCATAPELSTSSGRYYDKCQDVQPSRLAMDDALARELYVRTDAAIRAATPDR